MVRRLVALLALGMLLTGCASISPRANANLAFMGDSITAGWWLPRTNFGVPGNTTAQMLARYPDEVLSKDYKAVILLGGTNDVRGFRTAPEARVTTALSNIAEMAKLAEDKGLIVVLCTIPPIIGEDVDSLNAGIIALAGSKNYLLVDYFTPMVGHPEYFLDGLHPNAEGYAVMETALTRVISISS